MDLTSAVRFGLPSDYLQIEHENCVEDRHEEQRDERSSEQTSDLRVAKRLPKWSAVKR